ncbi:MAG: glycosyltransferase [Methanoregula sp.]
MNVVTVSNSDTIGGAALGAYHLHKSLQSLGVESQMVVQTKTCDDPSIIGPPTKLRETINSLRPTLDAFPTIFYKNKRSFFSPAWLPFSNIVDTINQIDADIVHLHWIAAGTMSIEDISRIKKPVVWSLHDMWPFTGGCHYDGGCGKYRSYCAACPALGSNRRNDLSHCVFSRKVKSYAKIPSLTLVGLSRWIEDCARNSTVFSGRRVVNISRIGQMS